MTVIISHDCDEVEEQRLHRELARHPMGNAVTVIGSAALNKNEVLLVSEDAVKRYPTFEEWAQRWQS